MFSFDSPQNPILVSFESEKLKNSYLDDLRKENFCSIRVYNDLSNLSEILYLCPDLIIFNADILLDNDCSPGELMSTLELLSRFVKTDKKYIVALGISTNTSFGFIKECKRAGIQGIVPVTDDFGSKEPAVAVKSLLSKQSWWPESIINKLPGAVHKPRRQPEEIQLTPRQKEILNLICRRGASNKKIAQLLDISESTVKVHVSAILKSYRVRNRTQLALSGIQTMSV